MEARATARGFLNYLINLRWVILQDAAVLMAKGRKHFIYDHLSEVFGSDLFKDYQVKMMAHLDRQTHNAPDKAKLDTLLPGVNQRLDNNANATSDMHIDIKSDLKTVIAQNEDMSMDKIEDTVMNSVNSVFGKLGRCMAGFDDVEKSDEEYLQQEIQQTRNPPSPSPYTNVQTGDVPYSVPSSRAVASNFISLWYFNISCTYCTYSFSEYTCTPLEFLRSFSELFPIVLVLLVDKRWSSDGLHSAPFSGTSLSSSER